MSDCPGDYTITTKYGTYVPVIWPESIILW